MIDPATAYAIQGDAAPSIYLYWGGDTMSFQPMEADQAALWLPMPVGEDTYALFCARGPYGVSIGEVGWAMTAIADIGFGVGMAPYQGLLTQQFKINSNTLNFCEITSLIFPGAAMALYDMKGTQFGSGGILDGPYYVLLTPPGWSGGGALVPGSDAFMLQQPTPCGTYPWPSDAVGQPLPALPMPTNVDSTVPKRLPADPAQDPLVGEMRIPFYLVSGDLSLDQQVANNPWYVMRHYQYWYLLTPAYRHNGGVDLVWELDWEVGTETDSSASLSDTMGITVQADGGFKLGGLSAGLSEKFTQQLGITISTTDKVLTTEKIAQTYHFLEGEAAIVANYVVGHRYELSRADGTLIRTWDVIANDMLTSANFSSLHPGGPNRVS